MPENNNKQRLLRLLAYLQKNTDVDHQASMADLCKVMGYENAEAGRKKETCVNVRIIKK